MEAELEVLVGSYVRSELVEARFKASLGKIVWLSSHLVT